MRERKAPKWASDSIHIRTEIRLSLWDRILILFSGRAKVEIAMDTENLAGRTQARSIAYPMPPRFTDHKD